MQRKLRVARHFLALAITKFTRFGMQWVKVFSSAQEAQTRLADKKPTLLEVGNLRICLVRMGDVFFAVSDACPHNGESLSKGTVNFIGEVVCPWHGYRFNLKTGQCAERCPDLVTYPVKISEEGFFIGL